jgi:hypothetical protein
MAQKKPLNDVQQQALDEADSIFERAFQEAASKVRATRGGDDSHLGECLRCDCGGFVPATGSGAPGMKCQRAGCGHSFPSHDFF